MSMMSDALDALYETLHDAGIAGEQVTLTVNGQSTTGILATLEKAPVVPPSLEGLEPGKWDFANNSPLNVDHDFGIMAADYAINGTPITPAAGHQIKRTFGGSTKVYELMASTANGAVWEWMDGYDKKYLIHTKFVSEE